MRVRLAMPEDIDVVVEMVKHQVEDTKADPIFDGAVVRQQFGSYLSSANPTIFVVADSNDAPIGLLWATINGYEYRRGLRVFQRVIYVSPENRGTRAAVLLTKHLIEWAKGLGASEIVGGTALSFQPERTSRFLEHFGFRTIGNAMSLRLAPE
jgi:L-amino acid N-acyltransferase YncA